MSDCQISANFWPVASDVFGWHVEVCKIGEKLLVGFRAWKWSRWNGPFTPRLNRQQQQPPGNWQWRGRVWPDTEWDSKDVDGQQLRATYYIHLYNHMYIYNHIYIYYNIYIYVIDGLSIGGNHLESWNRHSAPWKNFHHPSRSHDLCHRAAVQTCLDHGEKGPFEWTEEDLKHCILWSLTTDLFPWVQNWIDTTVGLQVWFPSGNWSAPPTRRCGFSSAEALNTLFYGREFIAQRQQLSHFTGSLEMTVARKSGWVPPMEICFVVAACLLVKSTFLANSHDIGSVIPIFLVG